MKSIKVSFDYDGRHYKFDAKFKWEDGKPQFTNHKCNESIICVNDCGKYIVQDRCSRIEVVTDEDMTEVLNVVFWDEQSISSAPLSMLGEFENCKTEIKGLWQYGRSKEEGIVRKVEEAFRNGE